MKYVCNHVYSCMCLRCVYSDITISRSHHSPSPSPSPHVFGSCNNHSNKTSHNEGYEHSRFSGSPSLRVGATRLFGKGRRTNEYSGPQKNQGWQGNQQALASLLIFIRSCQGLRSCIGQQIHGQSKSLKIGPATQHTHKIVGNFQSCSCCTSGSHRFREIDMTFKTYHLENSPNTSMFHHFCRDFPQTELF